MIGKLSKMIAVGAIVVLCGCATTEEIAEVRKMAEDAQASADGAAAAASEAQASATQAQQKAADAALRADQATQAADQAHTCCNANSETMQRMFQKTMSK